MTLSYSNEDDRAFGLAGMAVSLAGLDALDRIVDVSLDAEGPMVSFSQEYYYSLNPVISPKSVWENLMQNFHITSSMVIGNVLARSLVRLNQELPQEIERQVYAEIEAEGEDTCGLEKDEIETFYRRLLSRHRRIFANPRLHPAITELAGIISRRRRLSGLELREEMAYLQL